MSFGQRKMLKRLIKQSKGSFPMYVKPEPKAEAVEKAPATSSGAIAATQDSSFSLRLNQREPPAVENATVGKGTHEPTIGNIMTQRKERARVFSDEESESIAKQSPAMEAAALGAASRGNTKQPRIS